MSIKMISKSKTQNRRFSAAENTKNTERCKTSFPKEWVEKYRLI